MKREIDRANGIDFEEIKVELSKRQHLSPEFKGNRCVCKHCTTCHDFDFSSETLHLIAYLQLHSIFFQLLTLSRKYLLSLMEGTSYSRGIQLLFLSVKMVCSIQKVCIYVFYSPFIQSIENLSYFEEVIEISKKNNLSIC